ncbi:hypothetical protein Thermo_01696 [Thermoplasmatales archaeon]|nr:hypothetical protein Thermo_01696 [Thermoplasmatales archaeon]
MVNTEITEIKKVAIRLQGHSKYCVADGNYDIYYNQLRTAKMGTEWHARALVTQASVVDSAKLVYRDDEGCAVLVTTVAYPDTLDGDKPEKKHKLVWVFL